MYVTVSIVDRIKLVKFNTECVIGILQGRIDSGTVMRMQEKLILDMGTTILQLKSLKKRASQLKPQSSVTWPIIANIACVC